MIKIGFDSEIYPECETSILARIAGWSSGARRREWRQKRLFVAIGDPFELITQQGYATPQVCARSWWPADELTWLYSNPYSFWLASDYMLSAGYWKRFPKLSASSLLPRRVPHENTELVT